MSAQPAPLASRPPQSSAVVARLRGVSKRFDGESPVDALRSVDLDVLSGELMTISGPSGSGKSTLLNILGLLDRPTSGSFELLGLDMSRSTDQVRSSVRAKALGFVFQAFHLMDRRSVLQNVMIGGLYRGIPRRERADRSRAAIDRVGLTHRLGARASTLSGGERQRVAIARALVGDPPILLCDEPTGNLDSTTSTAIAHLLKGFGAQGIALVIVTHDPVVAALGGRRVAVRDGVVSGDTVAGVA